MVGALLQHNGMAYDMPISYLYDMGVSLLCRVPTINVLLTGKTACSPVAE